ncbi:ATP-grasp domain-containing protein [Nocardia sp. JMUB6875]|uniref:ATP-grasp domain-containing protein n=1 Tax=Nocardia sp. JMUB6875 TaxID=3158170 RepID=UPI0034E88627
MITTAFLQYSGKGPMRHEEGLLSEGLAQRGIPIRHYTIKRVHRRELPLGPDTFIAGDMDAMHGAMRQLGIPIPNPDDYPDCLRGFMYRKVWISTLADVEQQFEIGSLPPIFIKPADRRKGFPGAMFYSERDIAALGNTSRRQRVWCSEPVSWLSEYRIYVSDHRVISVDHYDGDPTLLPDLTVIESAISTYHHNGPAPAAYAIDFGILKTGETALIEVNDAYALGAYTIPAPAYTALLLRRWTELLATRRAI